MEPKWSECTQPMSLAFISFQPHNIDTTTYDKSHKQLTCDSVSAILHKWRLIGGTQSDGNYDARISYCRGNRRPTQNVRRNSQETAAAQRNGWIQNQWRVARNASRLRGISRQAEERSRHQIIKLKAGRIRLSKKFVASILLSSDWYPVDNKLDLCYLFTHYSCCHMATSSSAVLSSTRQWVLCGGREDTHMFVTIGNPLFQVYPYTLNSSYPIFGGSEAAL
jgi:hypothetical protein